MMVVAKPAVASIREHSPHDHTSYKPTVVAIHHSRLMVHHHLGLGGVYDSRLLHRIPRLLHRIPWLLHRVARLLHGVAGLLYSVSRLLYRVATLLHGIAALLYRVARLLDWIATLLYRVARFLHWVGGLLHRHSHGIRLSLHERRCGGVDFGMAGRCAATQGLASLLAHDTSDQQDDEERHNANDSSGQATARVGRGDGVRVAVARVVGHDALGASGAAAPQRLRARQPVAAEDAGGVTEGQFAPLSLFALLAPREWRRRGCSCVHNS
ncbi:hypothetical protein H257_07743 [Aphanomyces astaci]|uniref:Uncharacterized protein n=1 Tax=Aphanomyces astaci TaxID=112090 RepID=W4GH01_APHAT|nr:hypothetical protein H257_07743 [Aphanomyces astaci]ETV78957.1 hypothetical protein H257_07743 [Aphanomyces astaci]|eukprot:XP_009831676.1 hypothetical protein H257_07743 [Aphanomyces astaci]